MAQNAVVINMGSPTTSTAPTNEAASKEKKGSETLFGPNIGVVSSGPAWTAVNEKKVLADELTQEIVQGWVQKSKEASQPTTTLQALVNLKRPTLRLSPLQAEDGEDSHHHHGLEFEYDCDAPKCGIYVHVLLPSDHPDAPAASLANGLSKLLVFETVVEGGFGKLLKLDEGASLELDRFEHGRTPTTTTEGSAAPGASSGTAPAPSPSPEPTSAAAADVTSPSTANRPSRKRFTQHFHFRKRTNANRSAAGPALAVVDAEPSAATGEASASGKKDEETEKEGVRVTIRLAALDEQGTELVSPNEQVTYLQVVRFGAKPAAEGEEQAEDTRPWVVKVVKREATIGPHTFHLHEIYGLTSSSSSSHTPAPTAPLPDTNTYPPSSPPAATAQTTHEEEPSSECLLCLSSPREVVLLPCRHLVACKDCALNMVEFGAGGTITQAEEPAAAAAGAEAGENAAGGEGAAAGAAPPQTPAAATATTPVAPATTARRKRKAKGWFCPVCRQPYTSLLRITTNPPPPVEKKEEDGAEGEDATAAGNSIADAAPAQPEAPAPTRTGGLMASLRPGFLRSLSRPAAAQGDLESQNGTAARA